MRWQRARPTDTKHRSSKLFCERVTTHIAVLVERSWRVLTSGNSSSWTGQRLGQFLGRQTDAYGESLRTVNLDTMKVKLKPCRHIVT